MDERRDLLRPADLLEEFADDQDFQEVPELSHRHRVSSPEFLGGQSQEAGPRRVLNSRTTAP